MAPITVDPEALSGAGESIESVGDEIAAALSTLSSSLSGGAQSGLDPAGLVFGHAYQQSAQALLEAGAAAVNAGRGVGFGVQMSATNYSRADAASTIGGGAAALSPPDAPGEFSAPAAVPSSLGGGVPPPLLWSVIQTFIPDVWPDGNPAQLRTTASAWQGFGSTLDGIVGQLAGPSGVVAGQQIPEGGNMTSAISDLSKALSSIATEAGKLATQAREFADDVENTQNAIRDLLDRVSPSGFLDGIKAVFSGDALEELKEIAEDVKTVLGGFGRQAEARRDMLQIAMGWIDDAIVSVEKWTRREFPKFFGDDLGNALATGIDFQLTLGQGFLAGGADLVDSLGQLDPTRFAYDPEGAKAAWSAVGEDLAKTALYATPTGIASDPAGAFNHYKDKVEDAVHAEDWSSDRPGYGAGKVLFDVGAALIPGGAAARTGKVAADSAGDAAQAARRADLPGNPIDNLAPIEKTADDITDSLDDLDDIATSPAAVGDAKGPAIPESLVDPPSTPQRTDSPGAVPESPPSAGLSESPNAGVPESASGSTAAPDATPGGSSSSQSGPPDSTVGSAPHGADTGSSSDPADRVDLPSGPPAVPPTEVKIPGVDYALPADDALRVIEEPAAELARLADGKVPASILDGYDPLAGRTPDEFRQEFTVLDPNGNPSWDWQNQAPNNGFAGDPMETTSIPKGHELDRLGSNGGGFMADALAPLSDRAMPPGAAAQYHSFESTGREVPPGKDWIVQHGPAKPAFGQPGGANQWVVIDAKSGQPVPVHELIDARMIRETTPR